MPERQNVVVPNRVFPDVKSNKVAVDVFLPPTRKLGLVIRLEGNHVEPVAPDRNRPGILSRDRKTFQNVA